MTLTGAGSCAGHGAALAGREFGLPFTAKDEAKRRPNIIFLPANDMGNAGLGRYEAMHIPTPVRDRLTAGGHNA